VVSNATAVLIAAVVERRQKQQREEEQKVEDVKGELMEKLQEWDGVCMICRAARGMEERGHTWRGCRGKGGEEDEFRVQMMQMGVEQVQQMARQGGGQWIKWHECGRDDEGGCEWCGLMAEVAMALLYVGVEGVREWAAADKRFEQETDDGMEGMEVLERFFRREMWCRGVESNGMSELVRTWG
jgi:hypothetical protein